MNVCLAIPYKFKFPKLLKEYYSSYIHSQKCFFKGNENTKDDEWGVWATKRVQPTLSPHIILSLHSRRDQQIRMENNRTDFSRRFWRERVATFYLLTFKLTQKPLMLRFFSPLLVIIFPKLHSWLWRAPKTSTCLLIQHGGWGVFSPPRVADSLLNYQLLMCNYTWLFI